MFKKRIFKTIIILAVLIICMANVVSAATYDTWGPQWYTPYDAYVRADTNYFKGYNLQWSSTSIANYAAILINTFTVCNWELECRPNSGSPDDYWNGYSSFSSNLPSAYYEYEGDGDDVSVGCASCASLSVGTAYYGTLFMNTKAPVLSSYTIESEYGHWVGLLGDGIPQRYEWFKTNAAEGTTYGW